MPVLHLDTKSYKEGTSLQDLLPIILQAQSSAAKDLPVLNESVIGPQIYVHHTDGPIRAVFQEGGTELHFFIPEDVRQKFASKPEIEMRSGFWQKHLPHDGFWFRVPSIHEDYFWFDPDKALSVPDSEKIEVLYTLNPKEERFVGTIGEIKAKMKELKMSGPVTLRRVVEAFPKKEDCVSLLTRAGNLLGGPKSGMMLDPGLSFPF